MDVPDPEILHDAALGCGVGVVLALGMNRPYVAGQLVAVGAVLEGVAQKLDRMAARTGEQPARIVQITAHSESVSIVTATLTRPALVGFHSNVMERLAAHDGPFLDVHDVAAYMAPYTSSTRRKFVF